MKKIEISGKKIGEIFVKECIGGYPLRYVCECACGDTFTATSQIIRRKKVDCGCGIISGIRNKPFQVGDIYQGNEIKKIQKKYKGQTYYTFICGKCGKIDERGHSDFLKRPICSKCLKEENDKERDKKIAEEVVGKEINGIKIQRLSKREKGMLYVDVVCPVCGKEFMTLLSRVKVGINSCKECNEINLQKGHKISKDASVEGTNILAIKPDRAVNKNNTTGYKGVSKYQNGRYRAYINFKRKQYYLGQYDTLQQAVEARKIAETKIYGDFLSWFKTEHSEQWKKIHKNE